MTVLLLFERTEGKGVFPWLTGRWLPTLAMSGPPARQKVPTSLRPAPPLSRSMDPWYDGRAIAGWGTTWLPILGLWVRVTVLDIVGLVCWKDAVLMVGLAGPWGKALVVDAGAFTKTSYRFTRCSVPP